MLNNDLNRYIVIYVKYRIHLNFYLRFKGALEELGYRMIFVSNRLSLKIYAVHQGIDMIIISSTKEQIANIDISNSIEIKNGWIDISQGSLLFTSINLCLKSIVERFRVEYVFFINGNHIHDLALKRICSQYSIKKIFFELSNIPGKYLLIQLERMHNPVYILI